MTIPKRERELKKLFRDIKNWALELDPHKQRAFLASLERFWKTFKSQPELGPLYTPIAGPEETLPQ